MAVLGKGISFRDHWPGNIDLKSRGFASPGELIVVEGVSESLKGKRSAKNKLEEGREACQRQRRVGT